MPIGAGIAVGGVDAAVGQADVVEDAVQSRVGNLRGGWTVSTRSQRRAVSSMRVPVLARTCSLNWPLSVVGKKSWPSHGISRKAADTQASRNTGTKINRR